MRKARFDRADLARMLREGKSQKEIAKIFGVSAMAISKAAKKSALTVVGHAVSMKPGVSPGRVVQSVAEEMREDSDNLSLSPSQLRRFLKNPW